MQDDFLKRLMTTFRIEADEHISAMSALLVEMEKTSDLQKQAEIIEAAFREAHSLKGAARSVNMKEIESICRPLESIFAALKRKEITLSAELFDLLHESVDSLRLFLSADEAEGMVNEKTKVVVLIRKLEKAAKGIMSETESRRQEAGDGKQKEREDIISTKQAATETVRISTKKLDSILLQAEELLSVKPATAQRVTDLWDINATMELWKKEWKKIYQDVRAARKIVEKDEEHKLDKGNSRLKRLIGFLEWNYNYIESLGDKLGVLAKTVEYDNRSQGRMVDDLLDDTKRLSMLAFSSMLEIFPKLVRDLSREQGKDIELVIRGRELEIDRRILEGMKDPFIHLVRNCIDHGIEGPKDRIKKMKPAQGTIVIAISPKDSSNIEIAISDDGAGIDVARVRSAALKAGVISTEDVEKLSGPQIISLIYNSGISTSPIVTDISGRGLGLAIVRERVEKMGGIISLDTHPDAGATFRIVLPMTLAAFRGVLIRANERLFVIPTANVDRVAKVGSEEIKTVENRETIKFNGQTVLLMRLSDVLGIRRKIAANDAGNVQGRPFLTVVILNYAENRIAFIVDEILGEQEVLVKSLGKQLSRVRNMAGATILGSGKTVLILNVADLLKTAIIIGTAPAVIAETTVEIEEKEKSILVVEDSITARTLLKNILESAGYSVKTAVDGIDGFTNLKEGTFDLVVSDVDMPRMNGFDLTAKIRADKKLSELPVVLVTALQLREDRERGIDVGANAYIVKSDFDQSNLLEVVKRLI